ncbi:MAG: hypothetical protein ABSG99_08310 [Sedimentisphaerales bacterium]
MAEDRKKQKMKKLIVFSVLAAVFFYNGCGMVGLLGTPSPYEKKIPAEYNLAGQKGRKVLLFVEQPGWLSTQANLRYYLTEAIRENLIAKVKVRPEYIISYKELSAFRSNKSDFSSLSPAAVGKALGADIVLLVVIEEYQLSEVAESDYYSGILRVQAALFETANGEKVWPEYAESKSIKVSFEAEHGQETADKRLASACAHCITRYFYNCTEDKFKTFDEGGNTGWEEWKK